MTDDEIRETLNLELAKILENNLVLQDYGKGEKGYLVIEESGDPWVAPIEKTQAITNLYLAERAQVVAMCAALLAKCPFPDIQSGPLVQELKDRGLWHGSLSSHEPG